MKNEEIIKKVLKIYSIGGNWRMYLKEQVKKRESINIKNIGEEQ
ncbi:hypothetical protein phiCTC2B_17 (endogenous virus) [Clostridium phage phiCTC2B]|nr:hypothetical protein [Clostridium tetani]YP_009276914.1 hypothetical protein phiCT19406B_17 [Clostridium phage phiCT19406B]YP_009277358.1 hypothetical protein phiCTC2B_17 [Clostridium phage phiCTC2B]AJA42774.1 hypothetical protein phiCT19406B_17 [Clostridium phage phiCT19406B]AJA42970.1 hypothetical protein phiCTC2B_17 [Clostridium phage phiCTC2B]SKA20105.1 hypothetical protein SAMN02745112_02843 [Clostridium tetani]